MRKILQSKLGVGLLCVGAVLAVTGNFVSFPARRPVTAAAGTVARRMTCSLVSWNRKSLKGTSAMETGPVNSLDPRVDEISPAVS